MSNRNPKKTKTPFKEESFGSPARDILESKEKEVTKADVSPRPPLRFKKAKLNVDTEEGVEVIVDGELFQKCVIKPGLGSTTYGNYTFLQVPSRQIHLDLGNVVLYRDQHLSTLTRYCLVVEIVAPIESHTSGKVRLRAHRLYQPFELGTENTSSIIQLHLADKVTDNIPLDSVEAVVKVAFSLKARRSCNFHCLDIWSEESKSFTDLSNCNKIFDKNTSGLLLEAMGLSVSKENQTTISVERRPKSKVINARADSSSGTTTEVKNTKSVPMILDELAKFDIMDPSTWTEDTVYWNTRH